MNKKTEIIGTFAGFISILQYIPQVLSVWTQAPKPATDVSLGTFALTSLATLLWTIYGIKLNSKPVYITNSIVLVFSLMVLLYKLIYG